MFITKKKYEEMRCEEYAKGFIAGYEEGQRNERISSIMCIYTPNQIREAFGLEHLKENIDLRRGGSDADAGEYLGHKPQGVTGKHYTYKSSDRIDCKKDR